MLGRKDLITVLLAIFMTTPVLAIAPVVKTVPAIADNPTIPHDALPDKAVTLKGTSSVQGPGIQATWDFGDGSSPFVSNVANQYDVSTTHTYSGAPGSIFAATLTVLDTRTGESSSSVYRVGIREKSVETEVSIALDEALWYLHKTMNRTQSGASDTGGWSGTCGFACDDTGAVNASNVLAFESSGFLPSGDPSNPYTETVARAMNTVLDPSSTASIRNSDLQEAIAAKNPGYRTSLAARTQPGALSADTARALIDRQDPLGFWTVPGPRADAAFETSRSVVMLTTSFPLASGSAPILNVSNQVSVTTSGFLYNRVARTYNGTMTVTNTSASPIAGPIDVVLTVLTAGVTLANSNGSFNGDPYLVAPGVTILNPGQSATLTLTLSNPGNVRIDFTPVTYSGTFPPAEVSLTCPASTGTNGTAYSSSVVGAGGVQPYTYSIGPGTLPTPLTIDPNTGAITGTPSANGPFAFTANDADATGLPSGTANTSCTITISPAVGPLTLTCPANSGQVGVAYSSSLVASGGTPSYTYSITTGALPTPLLLNSSTGAITGTPDTAGPASFTGKVVDSTSGTPVTMTASCNIGIAPAATVAITVQTSPPGQSITVDGTTTSTAQSLNWVPGSSHTISTTSPQTSGGTHFVFNNWSDGGAIAHSVTGPASATVYTASFDTQFQLTTAASPAADGTVTPASGSFFASGSIQTVQATANTGFAFSGWTGPVASAISASTTVTMTAPITVTANFVTSLALTCPATTNAPIGTAYSSSLTASGGTTAYTYSLQSGTLPPPLALSPTTGAITGTPTTKGTYNFVGKVVDSTSPIQQTATASCSIVVPDRPPTATGQSVTTNEDTAKVITLAGSDPDGDPLTFVIVTGPAHGALGSFGSVSCAGTPSNCTRNVTYTPAANYNGADSFTFKVNDGSLDSTSNATVSITVNAVNDPPVALPKSYTAQANMKVSIAAASGLLIGATDPDSGDAGFTSVLSVGVVGATSPAGGTVAFTAATGAFDFDPPPGATGNVTFSYTVCDNGNPLPSMCSSPATVTVNVAGPVIWFANPALGSNGTGTLANPFNTLSAATTALGTNTNQRIFVFSGTTTSGTNVTLLGSDWLVGQGVTGTSFDTVMGITPPAGTIARPSIAGTSPIIQGTVNMNGSNTEVLGLTLQPPTSSAGLVASLTGPFTGLVVSDIPSITTTSARAVNLNNVSGTFNIVKVSATSADIGINLSNLNPSTGSFTVAGSGGTCTAATTTCTGGTILTSSNIGVSLSNANNVSLTRMHIKNSTHFGLQGTTVSALSVDTSVFDGTSGASSTEGTFFVSNWLTSGAISNSEILGASGDNVHVENTQGTLNRLAISNTIIRDNNTTTGNDGLRFATIFAPAAGSGVVMNLTVTGCTFQHHRGDHLDTDAQGLSSMDIVFSNNTLTGGETTTLGDTVLVSDSHSSHVTVDFNGNHITGAKLSAYSFFQSNTTTATASLIGKFRNNFVGATGVVGSGSAQGDGVTITATGLATITMNVTGNDIRQYAEFGIGMSAGDTSPHLNVTVTGNTVKEPFSVNALQGIKAEIGTTSAGAVAACLDIGGASTLANDVAGSGGNGATDIRVRQLNSSVVQLPGLTGTAATFISGRNTGSPTVSTVGTFGNNGGAACAQAP